MGISYLTYFVVNWESAQRMLTHLEDHSTLEQSDAEKLKAANSKP